jgi:uncharacterized membrane protein
MKREKAEPTQSHGLKSKANPVMTFLAILWLPLPIGVSWLKVSLAPFILTVWTVAAMVIIALADMFGIKICGGNLPLVCWLPAIAFLLPLYINKRKAQRIARATNIDPSTLYFQGAPYNPRFSVLPTWARITWHGIFAASLATWRVWRIQVTTLSHSQLFEEHVLSLGQLIGPWLLTAFIVVAVLLVLEWFPLSHWLLLETTVLPRVTLVLWGALILTLSGWYGYASCMEWWFRVTGTCLPRY